MSLNRHCITAVIIAAFLFPAVQAQDRVLEEIIVTAQRREQSLQEVPISLEAYTGAELSAQGLRRLDDLANYSPSVEIDMRMQDQDVSIRGLGTTGNNLSLEQAVPIFVDGIHFGRTSMIKSAFLDLERVEVLRGPQPIAFGQNATAGAFSLVTRKPGPEWEGDITAEIGNFGRKSFEGAIGGPITDTLGIRVAGKYDRMTGYIRDIVTNSMFPINKDQIARVILQWNPTNNLEVTAKAEFSKFQNTGDGNAMCRTNGLPIFTDPLEVYVPGLTDFDNVVTMLPLPEDCDKGFSRIGIREGGEVSLKPTPDLRNRSSRSGIIDFSETTVFPLKTHDDILSKNYLLGMTYSFDDDSYIEYTAGYVDYARVGAYDNINVPFYVNIQQRGEVFDMFSQDLRYISRRGDTFEFEAGLHWQMEDFDLGNLGDPEYQTITARGDMRTPLRTSGNWQDSEWLSAFGSLTFNFMDDRASLDVGGRYTKVNKDAYASAYGATWIMDINPDPDGNGIVPSTENGTTTVRNVASSMINCATGHRQCGSFGAGYWTHAWQLRDIPDIWTAQQPAGAGPFLAPIGNLVTGPFTRDYSDSSFDPQVVIRYRLSDKHSLYAKWATAFKGGGAALGTGSLAGDPDQFHIEAENAETFEAGSKGSFLGGRINYNVSLFQIVIEDLQIASSFPVDEVTSNTGVSGGSSFSTNAGKQRTRGIEFDALWAASDRLTLGVNGAIMKGVMVEYAGAGCTEAEFFFADTGPCYSLAESIAEFGTDDFEGMIDRSGARAPRTPDWKLVLDMDYWYPITDNYKVMFNSITTFTDGYVYNVEDFDEVIKYPSRIVANFNLGLGNMDDTWSLTFWVRNAFSEGVQYYPDQDVFPVGVVGRALSLRNWASYGAQLKYNYN